MITIICCYNNDELLKEFVYSSLKRQNIEYNLAFIDTNKFRVKSAAQAYNDILDNPQKYGVEITENLLFIHQDVYFSNNNFLFEVEEILNSSQNNVFGFAGMSSNRRFILSVKFKSIDQYYSGYISNKLEEVESLDECCFAMKYDLWKKVRFDEYVCNHWHLYSVEFCYNARKILGSKSYVLPKVIFHKEHINSESLTTDSHFLKSMWRLIRKHRDMGSKIYAPCYIAPTALIPSMIKITRTTVKNFLKKWLGLSF